jgi:hypothetical protein
MAYDWASTSTHVSLDFYKDYVFGATLGFFLLGVFTDLILRGGCLYLFLTGLIGTEILIFFLNTVVRLITGIDQFGLPNQIAFWFQGFIQSTILTLQLFVLPLIIAGKCRDMMSLWELPLAGQIVAMAQAVGIIVPVTIAPGIDALFKLANVNQDGLNVVATILLCVSIIPMRFSIKNDWHRLTEQRQ